MSNSVWGIISVTVFFIGLFMGIFQDQYISSQLIDWAYFGDASSGILGVLVSGLAVVLIWHTYSLQKEELSKTGDFISFQNAANIFIDLIERKDEYISKLEWANNKDENVLTHYIREFTGGFARHNNVEDTFNEIIDDRGGKRIVVPYLNISKSLVELLNNEPTIRKASIKLISIYKNSLSEIEKSFLYIYLHCDGYNECFEFMDENNFFENVPTTHTEILE